MQRPIVVIASLHLAGLVVGVTFPALGGWTALTMASVCLLSAAGAIRGRELDLGSRWVLLAVLPLGLWQGARAESQWCGAHHALATLGDGHAVTVCGTLASEPRPGRERLTLPLSPVSVTASDGSVVELSLPVEVTIPLRGELPLDEAELAIGDEIEAEGFLHVQSPVRNPGGFDRQAWHRQRGVAGSVTVTVIDTLRWTPGEPSPWASALRSMRHVRLWASGCLERQQGEEAGGFARAILLGERHALDPGDRHAFLLTGLGHLFAVSGLHTAMVFGLLLGGLRILRVPWRLSLAVAVASLVPFAALVGFRVSVVRAVILITALVFGRLIGRTVDSVSALALAALGVCVWDPLAPWQPGFQLSFLAVLTIALHAPLVRDLLGEDQGGLGGLLRRRLLAPALMLLAIHLALFPLMAQHFGLISWVSIPMNLLLVPMGFLVLFGSAVSLLGAAIWPWGANLIGACTGAITEALLALVRAVASWADAAVSQTPLPWWLIGLWYLILFGGFAVVRARGPDEILRRRARWAIAWLGLAALLIWLPLTEFGTGRLRVTFLDVGQGDSTLIEMPSGAVVVVDGGRREPTDMGLWVVEPALRARGIDGIDLLVATHPDSDHIGGLIHLLERFPVRRVAEGDPRGSTDTLRLFRAAIEASGAEHVWLSRGEVITDGRCVIAVLHPDPDPARRAPDTNGNSVVLDVRWREVDILLMGDAEIPAEHQMMAALPPIDCDVLRTGHHGSGAATGAEFLAEVTPAVGILSVGRSNPHGHPHPDVLARLAEAGALILRTDELGAITLETDGWTIWVRGMAVGAN
ncbi:DNA internalization-related competence protein ComEC/Rec2 [Candidatus Sumerlaeota bacterium]|nr:DNA internalization-related competence protein ComEC/Rec2 [Candidatus Sumerlaeota bacterium]